MYDDGTELWLRWCFDSFQLLTHRCCDFGKIHRVISLQQQNIEIIPILLSRQEVEGFGSNYI